MNTRRVHLASPSAGTVNPVVVNIEAEAQPSAVVASTKQPASFEDLYERSFPGLFRLATLLSGNEQEGEEVAQEAFVRLYARIRKVDNPDAYLRRIVVNLITDGRRRRLVQTRRSHYFESEARSEAAGSGDPADHTLLSSVASLPPRQRAAVVLRFYEGRSEKEIAEMLRCRPGTVKSLLSRALEALRLEVER